MATTLVVVVVTAVGARASPRSDGTCRLSPSSATYAARISHVLAAGQDVWGEALLRAPAGPTLRGAEGFLHPLLLAGHVPLQRSVSLTNSGVYYVPFAMPSTRGAPAGLALHLADGSEILSGSVDGARLRISVGAGGGEPYGSCLSRLETPRLYDGYLPMLETGYSDATGGSYREESFAARIPETSSLVSFVRIEVDSRAATTPLVVRFTLSEPGLVASAGSLRRGADTYLYFSTGGRLDGSTLSYAIPRKARTSVYVAWLERPAPSRRLLLDPAAYAQARASVVTYWQRRLGQGASFVVPERQVLDAERATLIQDLVMGWHYSVGNPYQEFEYPESLDAASVVGEYGFGGSERAALAASLRQIPGLYPDWEMGSKLLAAALYYRLYHDEPFLAAATPVLRGYVSNLRSQLTDGRHGLLRPERWTSDLPEIAYGFDGQAVVWQGLRAMGQIWTATGDTLLGSEARSAAARLGDGLKRAVQASERSLPDGSLFVPIKLYSGEQAHAKVLETRDGSYWNYELPYALASGLLSRQQAARVLRYLELHGSFLLGQERINAYALYLSPRFPTSGTDDVYDLNLARFLADEEQAGRLDVLLYGQLATGMTAGTYVAGEAASVSPIGGEYYRSMYLPPNSVANAAFLETLRLTLIHELDSSRGVPEGLELAYSTPRGWLKAGSTISVEEAPTSFGRISFTIHATTRAVAVTLAVPRTAMLRALRLRLRLPRERPLLSVELDGRPYPRFDRRTETIDLSGHSGSLDLTARY